MSEIVQERRANHEECPNSARTREDISEIKLAIREMATSMNKLALVEERQLQATAAQERCFGLLDKMESRLLRHDTRLTNLETKAAIDSKDVAKYIGWTDKAIYAMLGLVCMYVFKKTGLVI